MKNLWALLLLTAIATANPLDRSTLADLDGDGRPEKIGLVAGQLFVWDASAKLLWQGPQVMSQDDPFALAASSTLEWLGSGELISAQPQSEPGPTTFQRFHWDGTAFHPLGRAYLLQDSDDSFVWTRTFRWDGVKPLTWIVSLSSALQGRVIAFRGGGMSQSGEAQLQRVDNGMSITRWLTSLGNDN